MTLSDDELRRHLRRRAATAVATPDLLRAMARSAATTRRTALPRLAVLGSLAASIIVGVAVVGGLLMRASPPAVASNPATTAAGTRSPTSPSTTSPQPTAPPSPRVATWSGLQVMRLPADPFRDPTETAVKDVIAAGDGFLAVGFSREGAGVQGRVWRLAAGGSWQGLSVPEFSGRVPMRVFDVGPRYLALVGLPGSDGLTAWISPDGEAWTEGPALRGELQPDSAFGGSVGVVVPSGQSLRIISPDATDWRAVALPGAEGDVRAVFGAVAAGLLIVPGATDINPHGVGSVGAIWTSNDGTTWSRALIDRPGGHIDKVLPLGTGYVAIGGDDQLCPVCLGPIRRPSHEVWHSDDGLIWQRTAGLDDLLGKDYGFDLAFSSDGRRVVATTVRANGLGAYHTTDGVSWHTLPLVGKQVGSVPDYAARWVAGEPGLAGFTSDDPSRPLGGTAPKPWLANALTSVTTIN